MNELLLLLLHILHYCKNINNKACVIKVCHFFILFDRKKYDKDYMHAANFISRLFFNTPYLSLSFLA